MGRGLGSNVAALLHEQGHQVVVLHLGKTTPELPDVENIVIDRNKPDVLTAIIQK